MILLFLCRAVFEEFDIQTVANFDETKVAELLKDDGIVRHKGKIQSAITNAKLVLKVPFISFETNLFYQLQYVKRFKKSSGHLINTFGVL